MTGSSTRASAIRRNLPPGTPVTATVSQIAYPAGVLMRPRCRIRGAGSALIEILVVVVMIGLMMAIVVPRFRVSQLTRTREAADLLVRDLEAVRSRALATRSIARIVVNPGTGTYTGYLDADRDGALAQTAAETAALEVFRTQGARPGRPVRPRHRRPTFPASPAPGALRCRTAAWTSTRAG